MLILCTCHTVLHLKIYTLADGRATQLEASLALMPRSLLVFTNDAYTDCLHGIDAVSQRLPNPPIPPDAISVAVGA